MQLAVWLKSIYFYLFPVVLILSIIQSAIRPKAISSKIASLEVETTKSDSLLIIHNIVCTLLVVAGIFFLAFEKGWTWGLYLVVIPYLVQQAYNVFSSATIVGTVIRSSHTSPLSWRERHSLLAVGGVVWWLEYQGKFSVYNSLYSSLSGTLADLLLFVCLLIRCFAMLFFSITLLSIPADLLFNLSTKAIPKVTLFQQKILKQCVRIQNEPARRKLYSRKYWYSICQQKNIWKAVLCLFAPVVFVFDLCVGVILLICAVIYSTVLYCGLLLFELYKILIKPVAIFAKNSNSKNIALSFRLSMLIALSSLVILNRIDSFFQSVESSTAILEFIASSIVIPIVFEWISTIKQKKNQSIP